jgi:hypothetical protein
MHLHDPDGSALHEVFYLLCSTILLENSIQSLHKKYIKLYNVISAHEKELGK